MLHFIMQRQEVEGVPAGAPRLDIGKYVLQENPGVKRVGFPLFSYPGVRNNGKDEFSRLPSLYFVCCAVRALGFVRRLVAYMDDGRSVVVNSLVVCPDSCRLRKRLAIASDICGLRPN